MISISWHYFTFFRNLKFSQVLKLKIMNEKRFVDHDTSVEDYTEIFKNKNTKEKRKRGVKLLETFLRKEKSDEREVQNIGPAVLNKDLEDFTRSVRRKDGEDFEPSSLSLKTINKNLNLNMYIINTIVHGECFVQYFFLVFVSQISLVRFLIYICQQLVCKYLTPALSMKYSLYIHIHMTNDFIKHVYERNYLFFFFRLFALHN